MTKILVVSPHPDDETLGAGGSLMKLKDAGNQVYWLNITDVKMVGGGGTMNRLYPSEKYKLKILIHILDLMDS